MSTLSCRDEAPRVSPEAAAPLRVQKPAQPVRPVYAHSVVPGGVYSQAEFQKAVRADNAVRDHYAGINLTRLQARELQKPLLAYVSYRKDNKIYWTSRKVKIAAGEKILEAGGTMLRARCGNRISTTPKAPVITKKTDEPLPEELDREIAVLTTGILPPSPIFESRSRLTENLPEDLPEQDGPGVADMTGLAGLTGSNNGRTGRPVTPLGGWSGLQPPPALQGEGTGDSLVPPPALEFPPEPDETNEVLIRSTLDVPLPQTIATTLEPPLRSIGVVPFVPGTIRPGNTVPTSPGNVIRPPTSQAPSDGGGAGSAPTVPVTPGELVWPEPDQPLIRFIDVEDVREPAPDEDPKVPEPSTFLLAPVGLAALLTAGIRRGLPKE